MNFAKHSLYRGYIKQWGYTPEMLFVSINKAITPLTIRIPLKKNTVQHLYRQLPLNELPPRNDVQKEQ